MERYMTYRKISFRQRMKLNHWEIGEAFRDALCILLKYGGLVCVVIGFTHFVVAHIG